MAAVFLAPLHLSVTVRGADVKGAGSAFDLVGGRSWDYDMGFTCIEKFDIVWISVVNEVRVIGMAENLKLWLCRHGPAAW